MVMPASMSYGEDTILDKHYVPRRPQRTCSVLTFIARDRQKRTIVYANAELTRPRAGPRAGPRPCSATAVVLRMQTWCAKRI
jgi:hypothetical protein